MSPCTCCGQSAGIVRLVRDIAGRIVTTWCPRCDTDPVIGTTQSRST